MGNICSCLCPFRDNNKKEYNDHLIRDIYCTKCKKRFLSNNEYNKHIIYCNKICGDIRN